MTTTQQPANINKPIDFIPPSRRAANTATTFRNPCHVFGICLPKEQPKFSPVNVDKVKQPCDAKEKDGNEKSKDVSAQQGMCVCFPAKHCLYFLLAIRFSVFAFHGYCCCSFARVIHPSFSNNFHLQTTKKKRQSIKHIKPPPLSCRRNKSRH